MKKWFHQLRLCRSCWIGRIHERSPCKDSTDSLTNYASNGITHKFTPSRPSVLNNPDKPVDTGVQADLAIDILKAMFVEHGRKLPLALLWHPFSQSFYSCIIRYPQGIVPDSSQALHRRSWRKSF
jgi:hypothetical protein